MFSVHSVLALGVFFSAAVGLDTSGIAPVADETGDDNDETSTILKQLTIAMVSEVIDEKTLEIRDSSKEKGKRVFHLQLGNLASPRQGAAHSDDEHAAKLERSKAKLSKLVEKQMVWYKAAPEEHQPAPKEGKPPIVISDVWLHSGVHVNSMLSKEGFLDRDAKYHSELGRNILSAEAEEKKQDSYKELEKSMREMEKERKKQAAAEIKQEAEKPEPIGLAGWIGLGSVAFIAVVAMKFGRQKNKRTNLNRKKGWFESFFAKLKGA